MGRWEWRLLAAGLGLGAGGAAGVGWFYSSLLLSTTLRPDYPERVLDADAESVTLAVSRLTAQPGVWGLRWPDGLAVVGPVISSRSDGIRRSLLVGPAPLPGTAVAMDAGPYDPDPATRALQFEDVEVPTPLGPCPAWFVPAAVDGAAVADATDDDTAAAGGNADTWVVMVHGRGGSRREALRMLPALHRCGLPVLVTTYRNDVEAPASPDGHNHLGDTEWIDVEAAVQWARARGARRVVLFGWSMGAAIIGAFLDRSAEASVVAAVVWDAPLLDWRATLRRQARNRRLPPGLTPLATTVTRQRIGIDFDRFDLLRRPPVVRPPTLIVHSTADTVVPVQPSRELAATASTLDWHVRYLEVADAEHTGSWNADPSRYEQAVTAFLTDVLSERGAARPRC